MVRIKDIARKANVSTATVSYVLNDSGSVSEETRKKVLQVIEEMNYKPHTIAKSLKLKKTHTLGVVVEDITVFNAPPIIDGIHTYAEAHRFNLILTNMSLHKRLGRSYDLPETRSMAPKAVKELIDRQVDGIVYVGVHTRDVTGLLPEFSKPVVYTYCYTTDPKDYGFNYDDEYGAYEAADYMAKRGHRRIALISGTIDSVPAHDRFQGYIRALAENRLEFNPLYVKTGDWEVESGYRLAGELLSLEQPPTAILAMNDLMAAGAMRACEERGLSIPEDISLMGFDNREFAEFIRPGLTTMALPLRELGEKAAETLIGIVNGELPPVRRIQTEKPKCMLVERGSVSTIS